ncbi:phage tail tube assembly chaperone [Schleiferilactobacillus harbinensis]|uniref:phage tail tube assembly chaperone n=1 Tax=Schleiferilactobacillus harbinensis TaxID=304207 RepID=UPI0039ED9324
MEFTQIDASVLEIAKPVSVPLTQGNVRKSMGIMREIAKAQLGAEEPGKISAADQDGETAEIKQTIASLDAQLKIFDDVNDYVIDVLKLTKHQQQKLDDITFTQLTELAGSIAAHILGIADTQPTEDDQKSNGQ